MKILMILLQQTIINLSTNESHRLPQEKLGIHFFIKHSDKNFGH